DAGRALEAEVALFDMDRTLVDTHTAKLYLRFQRELGEIGRFDTLRSSYWLFQYSVGMVDAEQIAMRVLEGYRGKPEAWLRERCRGWFGTHVLECVSPVGRDRVRRYQRLGRPVAIATSAVRQAAQPLAEELGISYVVCSELEVRDGDLTGQFERPLCYGTGKLERARALVYSLGTTLERTSFYTDSITDLPLLEAVGYPVAINPDLRLRRLARRRGWPIEDWRLARRAMSATSAPGS
ncbi:MAG TPA: HAD-IB family hydrolase, partial [Polyangiaceae bacterium]|nr:HAD-IB family hydrolase [Polyangiaceae bacterium]